MTMQMLGPVMKPTPVGLWPTSGDIYIRDVGDLHTNIVHNTQVNLPKPTMLVDDDLLVLTFTVGIISPVNAADWTEKSVTWYGSKAKLWHRKATLTANDEFTYPSHDGNGMAIMISLRHLWFASQQPVLYQGGVTTNTTSNTDWLVGNMNANTTYDPKAFAFSFMFKISSEQTGADIGSNTSSMEHIVTQGALTDAIAANTIYWAWNFHYEIPSPTHPAHDMGFVPAHTDNSIWTQQQRYRINF